MRARLTYTVPEVAELLGISRSSAYECVRRGEIPALTLGRRVVIAKATIDTLLNVAALRRRGLRGDSMTRPTAYSAQGRRRASSMALSSSAATPNGRTRLARTSAWTRARASSFATTNLTAFTRSSRATCALSSTAPTDYFPRSYSSSNVRARAQHESSSTRSTDLPVALAPPADVNKHGSS